MESILISFCRTIFGVICDILILAAAKVLRGVITKPGAKHIMKNRYFLIRISFKLGCLRHQLLSSPLKRGAGGVLRQTYTPLYPLFLEGNHTKLKFLKLHSDNSYVCTVCSI